MLTIHLRTLAAAGMLAIALAGCVPLPREASVPTAMPAAPSATAIPATAVPATAIPATAVPATAVPATATAVPATAVPPAFPGAEWVELARGDHSGDGLEEMIYYIPVETIHVADGFGDDYLNSNAVIASDFRIVQEGAHGPFPWLIIDSSGVESTDGRLRDFPQGSRPAAFRIALDPGSMYFINVIPLNADGTRNSDFFAINWHPHTSSFGMAILPPAN